MILTGPEIERERTNGRITIEPFTPEQVNPNSYNFRLGTTLRTYANMPLDARRTNDFEEIEISDDGYVLEPGRLYLAHTIEVLGSEHYAPTFAARSSVARLGLFINLSASLGDIGYTGQWTLQLYTMNRVRVYPGISIGQMMWWRPQGEIVLYDGKYQGSAGPRSSDIHVDFDKQFARQRFPGLGASFDPDEVGPKFAQLAASSHDFRVPAAFCVPAGEFTDALTDAQNAALADAFTDLKATVGAFFTDSAAKIQKVGAEVRMPEQARKLLAARLGEMFPPSGGAEAELAVRSSGLDEDTEGSSLAGIHTSVLGVTGVDAAVEAVEACWRSHYEAPAVAARIRAGRFSPAPRLAVLVQRLVRPDFAGVAFTGLDGDAGRVTVEYVEGLADELVAGVAVPRRTDSDVLAAGTGRDAAEHEMLRQVVDLVRRLRASRGHDVDVEWAADTEGVHLVQVRPLTASREVARRSAEPVTEAHRLYADDLPAGFGLGAVAAVYSGYTAKRGPAHRLAHEHGVSTGAGWVLRFNGLGLHGHEGAAAVRDMLAGGTGECVLDFGENLRQIVVPKEEVPRQLAVTTGAAGDGTDLHTVIVRDFIRGELGVISRRTAAGGLVVEYTEEGLMALNRGTAGGEAIVVEDVAAALGGAGGPDWPGAGAALRPHLGELARFTAAMHAVHGPVTLEWVFDGGVLYFVDHSVLGDDDVTVAHGEVCISPGTARGPLLRLDDDAVLRRLSIGPAVSIDKSKDVTEHEGLGRILDLVTSYDEKPVISAARPYAVLSVLIEHVAGFVFDQGSALGHLAILLREAGIPAVTADGIEGAEAVISDGTVATTGRKGERA
ncbi:PEP/pyruvate-binding domain-containing protein [Streptomyces sp. QL37]|uniref:dCTP deaminase domain-containing protein n=1 Tax=Streptomyces sp. QL37 TaxID=2093747 RepID=UPI000CF2EE84|nr:PEP/pyruvate-binding domain-containing protein [Streptomyces sp. QL37]PPQ57554.1 deoxycytidine triphosphate deaminase [Streptomyces sp. QL37]